MPSLDFLGSFFGASSYFSVASQRAGNSRPGCDCAASRMALISYEELVGDHVSTVLERHSTSWSTLASTNSANGK